MYVESIFNGKVIDNRCSTSTKTTQHRLCEWKKTNIDYGHLNIDVHWKSWIIDDPMFQRQCNINFELEIEGKLMFLLDNRFLLLQRFYIKKTMGITENAFVSRLSHVFSTLERGRKKILSSFCTRKSTTMNGNKSDHHPPFHLDE